MPSIAFYVMLGVIMMNVVMLRVVASPETTCQGQTLYLFSTTFKNEAKSFTALAQVRHSVVDSLSLPFSDRQFKDFYPFFKFMEVKKSDEFFIFFKNCHKFTILLQ